MRNKLLKKEKQRRREDEGDEYEQTILQAHDPAICGVRKKILKKRDEETEERKKMKVRKK
jgi:hypothetical protein